MSALPDDPAQWEAFLLAENEADRRAESRLVPAAAIALLVVLLAWLVRIAVTSGLPWPG